MVGLCRLCASLRKIDVLTTIEDESNEICQKLRNCCQLDIKMQDVLPKSICQDCVENLNKSHAFYKKVKEAQETLQALYPTPNEQEESLTENEAIQDPYLVQNLSTTSENLEKTLESTSKQEKNHSAKQNEQKLEKASKQTELENYLTIKCTDPRNEPLLDESNVRESGQSQKTLMQKVYDMLDFSKEDATLEDTYEILNAVEGSTDSENFTTFTETVEGKSVECQNLEENNFHNTLAGEITEETEIVIMSDKDDSEAIEIEYMADFEDGEEYENISSNMYIEQSENDGQQIKHITSSTSWSILRINSWKQYNYLCFICDIKHCRLTDLKVHVAEEHNINENIKLIYKCYDCQKLIPRYNFFLNHVRSKHHPDLKLRCDICDLNCQNFEELSYHRSANCAEASNDEHILPCNLCFKSFSNTYGLQNHFKIQHSTSKVKYKCSICNKEFQHKSSLKIHTQMHTNKDKYSCNYRVSKFKNKHALEQHIHVHDAEKQYKCNICNKSFKTYHSLDQHHILHTDKKRFKCQFCEKRFHKKIQKIAHERTHTGEMPFSCTECDKRFRYVSALNAHKNCHTGAKPYLCEYCNRTFADSSNRNKHVRRKHPNNNKV